MSAVPNRTLNPISIDVRHEDEEEEGEEDDESVPLSNTEKEPPSNTLLLCTAFVSFMTFATVQMFFAFLADSQAMKGDSAAMMVDSMTYVVNWYAERRKDRFDREYPPPSTGGENPESAQRIRARQKRKMVLLLEIIPPLVSVTTLVGVTFVILKNAIQVILQDTTTNNNNHVSQHHDPSLNIMIGFSLVNLALDFLNVLCFARSKHWAGFQTTMNDDHHHNNTTCNNDAGKETMEFPLHPSHGESHEGHNNFTHGAFVAEGPDSQQPEPANLNMCSAYTHVFADTLRTIAVILAVLVAKLVPSVSAEQADSAAAIAVSILILLSLVPLFRGLYQSVRELLAIWAQERSEKNCATESVFHGIL